MKKIINQFSLKCFLFIALVMGGFSFEYNPNTDPYNDYAWMERIHKESPRLFFNSNTFQKVKERALNEEKDILEEIKNRIDNLLDQNIEIADPLASNRGWTSSSNDAFGTRAAEAAFLHLVFGEKKYLDLSKKILNEVINLYQIRNKDTLAISWYNNHRMMSLAAYDWIYNYLTESEKYEMGSSLLHAINFMVENRTPGDNDLPIVTGYYGTPALSWYAGVVFYEKGIDDSMAVKLLKKGYENHIKLLEHRSNIAGEYGGAATAAMNYAITSYPGADFNFLHTFNSATGLDISKEWPYIPYILHYALWNWLPGDKQFGYGDNYHTTNDLSLRAFSLHISQMIHFYGDTHPRLISLGKWMQQKIGNSATGTIPFTRFLLTNTYAEIKPEGPPDNMPKGMLFKNMGQIFMRSGSGPDDTYALFTAGGVIGQGMHRHYDNNNFVIFRQGFLALDSGNRPEPGTHLSHYYSRTVAHNCVLIKMPGETMPRYWGRPAPGEEPVPPVPNDGGQSKLLASEVVAFDPTDLYVYIASDATESYHEDKANLVLRQFVFLPPDHFVIFDRVTSTKPEYKKTWLLHTAAEPNVSNNEFFTDHWEGRLFCRTLLPADAELTKIGGPGKQFWSDGRNWPMPSGARPDTTALFGQWRVEVSPGSANKNDLFLHFIQVGDSSLKSMVESTQVSTDDMTGVRFSYENKEYEVLFNTEEEVGGKIIIKQGSRKILEEEFERQVKQPKSLF